MEELYIYIKQLRNQLQSLERRAKNLKELCGELALDNDRLLEENPILRNQLQSLERRAKNLKELSEELALDKDRLLQENNQLGSEVGTMTEQVNAAETNATMVKKVTLILTMIVLDYDRLLKENKNLKNQWDWEMVTSADKD
ncbi:uncharacterized protein LOC133731466 [Rosa rugosa]|uniref:uncharacterized protein LOC133731466 n=1 Tax=Rosa rugosa TaxID=74645 RepID=UPI002B412A48|nr:uncharacterized protein LOC133731466 [Rosa rugosa]